MNGGDGIDAALNRERRGKKKRPGTGREVRYGSPVESKLAPTGAAAETQAQPGEVREMKKI